MEATEMRRSTLQRKDRGELNQIAAALGAKPSSRARKDEIIQLIIDLTADGARISRPAGESPPAEAAPGGSGEADQGLQSADNAGASGRDGDQNGEGSAAGSREESRPADRGEDEVDPGNRRRRRRNRDRDRDRDDSWDGDPVAVAGRLDLRDEGYGFLRVDGCLPNRNDAYVPVKTIRQYGLRRGDHLTGTSRPANRAEKNPALLTLESINGGPAELSDRPQFESLTPIHAVRRLTLEQPEDPDAIAARLIDLVAPIGIGQRVLVTGPRRSGASELLTSLITAIETNEPDIFVMGLFLDQRPEDVTEVRRCVRNGDVAATSFEQTPEEHVQTAEMTIERVKRLVESGRNVAVVLDSLTSLAQAYNAALSNAGRAYSGNVESGAVHMPKKLFGAGRNVSESGSVTMIASIVSDGSSSLPGVLSDEFVGTANTEIRLDRWAAQLGLFPAIDLSASVSRDEDRFIDADEVQALQDLRRSFTGDAEDDPGGVVKALETALSKLRSTASNAELLR
ncbi:MAG: transcription termination factor Rho [Acidimicrobiaceae bacterium]|nr:transcription termination factor Rho [Acidimicrobiaceae bacterium]MYE96051.1 transcription termination factor Rho [Acidimicrobiaceae bacterium]MYI55006.1 transcription termination factor Rho [Acidimicrobiaceae bacterium]